MLRRQSSLVYCAFVASSLYWLVGTVLYVLAANHLFWPPDTLHLAASTLTPFDTALTTAADPAALDRKSLPLSAAIHPVLADDNPPPTFVAHEQPLSTTLGRGLTRSLSLEAITNDFAVDTPEVHCVWRTNISGARHLRAVWIAVDTHGHWPALTRLTTDTVEVTGRMYGSFSLLAPARGWAPGRYHLELYLNDTLVQRVAFAIGQDRGQPEIEKAGPILAETSFAP